jgi:ABC-2 type transport system permease protein
VVFFTLAGILAACAGVQMIARLRQDEAAGLAEPLLAGAVGRVRWFGAGLALSASAILGVLAAAVAGAGLGVAVTDGADTSLVRDAAISAVGQALAAAVIAVVAAAAFVVLPRAAVLIGWALVALAAVIGLFGPLLGLPDAVVHVSPLASVPIVSGDGVDPRAGGVWAVVLVMIGAAAVMGVRRREVTADR